MRCVRSAICLAMLKLAVVTGGSAAFGFPTQDDQSPGVMGNQFRKRSNVWMRLDAGVLDGQVTTTPPDSTTYDRRLEALAIVGGEGLIGSRFGARLNVKAETTRRRVAEEEVTTPIMDESTTVYKPSFDLSFVTDKGLELFGGVAGDVYAEAEREEDSINGKTKTTFAPGYVLARRFGVTRRAGQWSGGFYYVSGGDAERDVEVVAFDDSVSSAKDNIFIPSRFGVFGEINAGALWDFELAFVQARGLGPRDENGITAYTDYFEARFGGVFMLGSGLGLKTGVAHKTLSYANSSFVTLETMPMTSGRLVLLFGDAQKHLYAGLIGGSGSDGQSLPEFNARYRSLGYALTLGFFAPL